MTDQQDTSQQRVTMILFGPGKGDTFQAGWFGEGDSAAVITAAAQQRLQLLSVAGLLPEVWHMVAKGHVGKKGVVKLGPLHRDHHVRLLEMAAQQDKGGFPAASAEVQHIIHDDETASDGGQAPQADLCAEEQREDDIDRDAGLTKKLVSSDDTVISDVVAGESSLDVHAQALSTSSPVGLPVVFPEEHAAQDSGKPLALAHGTMGQRPKVQPDVKQSSVDPAGTVDAVDLAVSVGTMDRVDLVGPVGVGSSDLLASLKPGDVVLAPEIERSGDISGYWPAVVKSVETATTVVLAWRDEPPTYPRIMRKRDQLAVMPLRE